MPEGAEVGFSKELWANMVNALLRSRGCWTQPLCLSAVVETWLYSATPR